MTTLIFCYIRAIFSPAFGDTHGHVQKSFKLVLCDLSLDIDLDLKCQKLALCRMHWKIYLMNVHDNL